MNVWTNSNEKEPPKDGTRFLGVGPGSDYVEVVVWVNLHRRGKDLSYWGWGSEEIEGPMPEYHAPLPEPPK